MSMKWKDYKSFRSAVIGKNIDQDKVAGVQCVDLFKYFTKGQVGKTVPAGINKNGVNGARNYWEILSTRKKVLGLGFSSVTKKSDLKAGDWIITSDGVTGHVGMVTGIIKKGSKVKLLGQNQNGLKRANEMTFNLRTFLGGFRFKGWNVAKKKESTETKKTTKKKSTDTIAKEVVAGKWGNGDARKKKLTAAGYVYNTIQKAVNKLLKKGKK